MTLKEAILHTLREFDGSIHIEELTAYINVKGLYRRKDGVPLISNQVSARIAHMPEVTRPGLGIIKLL